MTSGGSIIKGHDLVSATTGKPNDWGMVNYVGNAQEWVTSDGQTVVRGGAYTVPLSKCSVSLSVPHDGSADEVNGFSPSTRISQLILVSISSFGVGSREFSGQRNERLGVRIATLGVVQSRQPPQSERDIGVFCVERFFVDRQDSLVQGLRFG